MDSTLSSFRVRAFTLIELLCAMAIIGVLAALLLPAVSQAGARAKRVQCLHQLHQIGVSFHAFAHDHNSQFPMAIPASTGGSQEFLRGALLASGEYYFSFRHFQALSNDLATPKVLVCPADTRLPATNFAALGNSNLSYVVGLRTEYGQPNSILAGDRNVTNDWTGLASLLRLGPQHALRWTHDLHRFNGNLLFGDGHVSEMNGPGLIALANQFQTMAVLALPTARPPGAAARGSGASWAGGNPGSPTQALPNPGGANSSGPSRLDTGLSPGTNQQFSSATSARVVSGPVSLGQIAGLGAESATNTKAISPEKNAAPANAPAAPPVADSWLTGFPPWFAAIVEGLARKGIWLIYLVLLLIVVIGLVLRKLYVVRRRSPKPRE